MYLGNTKRLPRSVELSVHFLSVASDRAELGACEHEFV